MATAKADEIIDGDTFKIRSGKCIRPTPTGYNTPEKGERGYQKATKHLEKLIKGKTVGLSHVLAVDRGREIRRVTVNGKPLEKLMKPYAKKR